MLSSEDVWQKIRSEALEAGQEEPLLHLSVHPVLYNEPDFKNAILALLAINLSNKLLPNKVIRETFDRILVHDEEIISLIISDFETYLDDLEQHYKVFLFHPGFQAGVCTRIAQYAYKKHNKDLALLLKNQALRIYGADIHPNIEIGEKFKILSPTGVFINQHCQLGDKITISPGVKVGTTPVLQHATIIKSDSYIGANAVVFNDITVGEKAWIGQGAVVNKSIPDAGRYIGQSSLPEFN